MISHRDTHAGYRCFEAGNVEDHCRWFDWSIKINHGIQISHTSFAVNEWISCLFHAIYLWIKTINFRWKINSYSSHSIRFWIWSSSSSSLGPLFKGRIHSSWAFNLKNKSRNKSTRIFAKTFSARLWKNSWVATRKEIIIT